LKKKFGAKGGSQFFLSILLIVFPFFPFRSKQKRKHAKNPPDAKQQQKDPGDALRQKKIERFCFVWQKNPPVRWF